MKGNKWRKKRSNMGFIYIMTNILNNKQYVGQTIRTVRERIQQHNMPSQNNTYLDRYINKHGTNLFTVDCFELENHKLNDYEELLIKELNSKYPKGFNVSNGGSTNSGWTHTEEAKQRISKANKGKPRSALNTQLSKSRTGCLHQNAKKFKVVTPESEELFFHGNLNRFCEANDLNYATMIKVAGKKQGRKQHKGYKCSYVVD